MKVQPTPCGMNLSRKKCVRFRPGCVTVPAGIRRLGAGLVDVNPNGVADIKPRVAPKALPWVDGRSITNPNGVVARSLPRVDPLRSVQKNATTPLGLP